jgi:hypothetical protein
METQKREHPKLTELGNVVQDRALAIVGQPKLGDRWNR